MASTYTTSLQIQKIGSGEQSGIWGATTNTNWDLIEQAVAGVQNITMLNADYTLTVVNGASDEARNMVIVAGGTNSAIRKIIAPLAPKVYVVNNNTSGGYAITIGGSTGSVVTIPSGVTITVYCDGTNFYTGSSGAGGNFNVPGDLAVSGNETIGGNLTVSGATTAYLTTSSTAVTQSSGDNSTKIATTAFVLQNAVPTGSLIMWSTASAPFGFLICNGSAVSRSTYAALFAVVGTTFGSGDGSTTFNLPNYQDRMPIGAGSSYAVAATGGSKDAIVVSHTHTASTTATDSGHTHTYVSGYGSTAGIAAGNWHPGEIGFTQVTNTSSTGNANISASTSIGTTGSSGTNANLPPYLGIYFIIKT